MTRFFTSVRSRWWVLGALWVATSLLGFWGMSRVAGQYDGAPAKLIDRFYLLPEFFGRGIDFDLAHANWQLDVARLAGPTIAGLTFFQGLATIFSERIDRARARTRRDHIVVCGLGEKGSRLARDFMKRGERVVAIEIDPTAGSIESARRAGATVIIGDATDPHQLRAAGAHRAAELVAVCGADADNADIADHARSIVQPRPIPLRCTVHLRDDRLAGQLRLQSMREDIADLRVEFFSIYRGGAAVWVSDHIPFTQEHATREPHLVVIGLGQLGRSLVVRAGQAWAESSVANGRPLHCTLIDRAASGRAGVLRLEHPAIIERLDLDCIDLDLSEPKNKALKAMSAAFEEGPDAVFVAFDDDEASLAAALLARNATPRTTIVVARTSGSSGVGALMADDTFGGGLGIEMFPLIDRTCTVAVLELGVNELLARSLHDAYREQIASGKRSTGGFDVPWQDLPKDAQESNRAQAEEVCGALDAAGINLIPVRRWSGKEPELSADEVEKIAEVEHERWRAERTKSGWTYGKDRDDAAKRNPLLRPWAELPDEAKEGARENARQLPRVLARAGFEIVKGARRRDHHDGDGHDGDGHDGDGHDGDHHDGDGHDGDGHDGDHHDG